MLELTEVLLGFVDEDAVERSGDAHASDIDFVRRDRGHGCRLDLDRFRMRIVGDEFQDRRTDDARRLHGVVRVDDVDPDLGRDPELDAIVEAEDAGSVYSEADEILSSEEPDSDHDG